MISRLASTSSRSPVRGPGSNADASRGPLIAGVALLVALAAAVAVWLLPMPFLRAPSMDALAEANENRGGFPGPRQQPPGETQDEIEQRYVRPTEPWEMLTEPLSSLIDPPPEPEPVQEEQVIPEGEEEEEERDIDRRPPPPNLAWRYVGYMGNDDNAWAMIEVGGQQRVYGVGDTIRDPAWENEKTARIVEVRRDGVLVRTSEEIEYEFGWAGDEETPEATPGRRLDARTGA